MRGAAGGGYDSCYGVAAAWRDAMDMHGAPGDPNEERTSETVTTSRIVNTRDWIGDWTPYKECSKDKVDAKAVPNITYTKATKKLEGVFVDLGGPKNEPSVGQRRFVTILEDALTEMTWVHALQHKSHSSNALNIGISEVATPGGLKVSHIRTDEGGEFGGGFQRIFDKLKIKHEMTPSGTPHYNGVEERRFGVIQERAIPMLESMTEGRSRNLRAEAMNFSADMYNRCIPAGNKPTYTPTRNGSVPP